MHTQTVRGNALLADLGPARKYALDDDAVGSAANAGIKAGSRLRTTRP